MPVLSRQRRRKRVRANADGGCPARRDLAGPCPRIPLPARDIRPDGAFSGKAPPPDLPDTAGAAKPRLPSSNSPAVARSGTAAKCTASGAWCASVQRANAGPEERRGGRCPLRGASEAAPARLRAGRQADAESPPCRRSAGSACGPEHRRREGDVPAEGIPAPSTPPPKRVSEFEELALTSIRPPHHYERYERSRYVVVKNSSFVFGAKVTFFDSKMDLRPFCLFTISIFMAR